MTIFNKLGITIASDVTHKIYFCIFSSAYHKIPRIAIISPTPRLVDGSDISQLCNAIPRAITGYRRQRDATSGSPFFCFFYLFYKILLDSKGKITDIVLFIVPGYSPQSQRSKWKVICAIAHFRFSDNGHVLPNRMSVVGNGKRPILKTHAACE